MAGELQLPTLVQRFRIDGTGARQGVAQVDSSNKSLVGSFGGVKTAVTGALGAFLAFKGVSIISDVVKGAETDIQTAKTTISLFGQKAGGDLISFSNKAATSLGLADDAFLTMTDNVGTMLKGFGLAPPAAAEMSKSLVKISVDVAAFKGNGTQASDVLQGLQRGLTGAARGLKVYGVDTSAAAIKTAALSLHIKGTQTQWTAAQKAAVYYQLILKGTAQETGTFAARSGDLTNQQKILTAQWDNMKDNIGAGLLPVVTTLFSTFTSGFAAVGPDAQLVIGKVVGVGLAATVAAVAVFGFARAGSAVVDALTSASRASAAATAQNAEEAASADAAALSAEADAAALRDKAAAYGQIVASGGAAIGFTAEGALALDAEAAAAEVDAAALRQAAIAATEAGVASKGLLASMGPVGIIALGIGAAVAFLTAKTALFSHGQQDAGKATNDFIDQLLAEGDALDLVGQKVIIQFAKDHADLVAVAKTAGVSLTELSSAVAGNGKAYDDVRQKLEVYKNAQIAADTEGLTGHNLMTATAIATEKYNGQVRDLTTFIDKQSRSVRERNDIFKEGKSAVTDLAHAEDGTVDPAKRAAQAQRELADAATNLTTAIINNADRLRSLQEGLVGVLSSAINLRQEVRDLADKQTAYNDALKAHGKNSREAAAAADDLALAQLRLKGDTLSAVDGVVKQADSQSHLTDHLKAQADATKALAKANADAAVGKGNPGDVAAAQTALDKATVGVANSQEIQRKVIEKLAARVTGPLHVALLQYLRDTQGPKPIVTPVTTPGLPEATLRVHNYRGELDGVSPTKSTKVTADTNDATHKLGDLLRLIHAIDPHIPLTAIVRAEGGRAGGGPVEAGKTYPVGEAGEELLTLYPGGGGFVTSHSAVPHALASTNRDLTRSLGPVPMRASTSSGEPPISVTWDVDIHPQEHTLTERSLIDHLRYAERHGPLHSQTGVPREVR